MPTDADADDAIITLPSLPDAIRKGAEGGHDVWVHNRPLDPAEIGKHASSRECQCRPVLVRVIDRGWL